MPSGANQASCRNTCPAAGVSARRSRVTCQTLAIVRCASPPSAVAVNIRAGNRASKSR